LGLPENFGEIEDCNLSCRNTASAIENYCAQQDKEMRGADAEIKSLLSNGWTGEDARAFGQKWEAVDANDSAAIRLRNALAEYGKFLTNAASKYQAAQEETYNDANLLSRLAWW
jgi:hypothetical protein